MVALQDPGTNQHPQNGLQYILKISLVGSHAFTERENKIDQNPNGMTTICCTVFCHSHWKMDPSPTRVAWDSSTGQGSLMRRRRWRRAKGNLKQFASQLAKKYEPNQNLDKP